MTEETGKKVEEIAQILMKKHPSESIMARPDLIAELAVEKAKSNMLKEKNKELEKQNKELREAKDKTL